MARKVRTEQEKRRHRRNVIIGLLFFIILIGVGFFLIWKFVLNNGKGHSVVEVKVLNRLDEYQYSLTDKDSKYFKSEYEILKKILISDTVDKKEYATQVARLFTIDLYTMSTKINKYDVGGIEYFYENKKEMFENKVMDTLYSTLLDNTYGDRKQKLPEVKQVDTVSVEEMTYYLDEEAVDAYLVKLDISYIEDLKYDKEASVVVCKEDGIRWSVVDFQPTLNPKYS